MGREKRHSFSFLRRQGKEISRVESLTLARHNGTFSPTSQVTLAHDLTDQLPPIPARRKKSAPRRRHHSRDVTVRNIVHYTWW